MVVLQNMGTNSTTISANGAFTFSTQEANNSHYAITVLTQPTGQTCTVMGASGSVNSANVSSTSVVCAVNTYTIAGVVSGLNPAAQLTMQNNGGNSTIVKANGAFMFSTPVDYGANFAVSVTSQPPAESCTVSGGSQSAVMANVSNVGIACSPATESIIHSFAPKLDGIGPAGNLILATDGNFYGTTSAGGQYGFGSVFKITPQGIETVLHSFSGRAADGNEPLGGLVQGSDGNFYGTTFYGGSSVGAGGGTVFKITPTGVETVLHSFGGDDGIGPAASLVQGSDGNFYGTTSYGGGTGGGTVFKITPEGTETVLHIFSGGPSDGGGSVSALIQGSDGNFYGTTPMGGASAYGTVFKIDPTGLETIVFSFTDSDVEGQSISALVQGSDGNFYGTTVGRLSGTIFRLTPAGVETTLYTFTGGADGGSPQSSLIQGRDGNFYGTTQYGGTGNTGTVYMVTAGGIETVLHSFAAVPDAAISNGTMPKAALVQGNDGSFYGTASVGGLTGAGTVFQITTARTYTVFYQFDSGPEGAQPTGLIQASDGNFYGATTVGGTSGNGTVFKMTPAGAETVLYCFAGGTDGASPIGGVIEGSDGNFYGTTSSGGANGYGTVYKISPVGVETVIHSFSLTPDGIYPKAGLVEGSDGNFYGTTSDGGAGVYGTAYRVTPSGTMTVLYAFAQGSADGKVPWAALIQGADGNFYGTTLGGGASNQGTVFSLTPSGTETVLYSFTGQADGSQPVSALLQASDGTLYGTSSGGSGAGSVFKITTHGDFTLLHAFVGDSADGSSASAALVQGNDGNLYSTTQKGGAFNLGTLFEVTQSGTETVLYSFGGPGDGASVGSLIVGSDGEFYGTTATGGSSNEGVIFRY